MFFFFFFFCSTPTPARDQLSFHSYCISLFTWTEITLFDYTSAITINKQDKMYGPYDMDSFIYAFDRIFSTVYVSWSYCFLLILYQLEFNFHYVQNLNKIGYIFSSKCRTIKLSLFINLIKLFLLKGFSIISLGGLVDVSGQMLFLMETSSEKVCILSLKFDFSCATDQICFHV